MNFDKYYILRANDGICVGFCRIESDPVLEDTYSFWCCPGIEMNSEIDTDLMALIRLHLEKEDHIYQEISDSMEYGFMEFLGKYSFQLAHEFCEKKYMTSFRHLYSGTLTISDDGIQAEIFRAMSDKVTENLTFSIRPEQIATDMITRAAGVIHDEDHIFEFCMNAVISD